MLSAVRNLELKLRRLVGVGDVRHRNVRGSHLFLRSLKRRFEGRRGFVIGNGPSLRISDLEMLRSEICIASNKIYLAFGDTQWRPTLYTIVDDLVWDKIGEGVEAYGLRPVIPSYLAPKPANYYVVKCLGNAVDLFLHDGLECFSDDACHGLYGGYTVTFENLQLAFHLGLNPVYLVGCDHFYAGEPVAVTAQQAVAAPEMSNHFVPNYRVPGELVNPAPIGKMNIAYKLAHNAATQSGRRIINATRGGHLDAFPRADLDELFSPDGC